jgi:mannose-6-phosphate isomerase
VLIKFIDAKQDLSVQVHPSDEYALKNENSFGKTEMWYIVEAEEGAGIYLGFRESVTKEEYEKAIAEKRLTDLLNFYEVKAGECYFIPSGTIHAIGKGCLICEIQQNSNLTYRVYDYGRKDKNGIERELHIDKALKVTNLNKFEPINFENCLGKCEYFTVQKYEIDGEMQLCTDEKSFQCVTCVKGNGFIDGMEVSQGDSFFIPANFGGYRMTGKMEVVSTKN